jgi:hypothetical protein
MGDRAPADRSFLGEHLGERVDGTRWPRSRPSDLRAFSPAPRRGARQQLGGARAFGGARLPRLCGGEERRERQPAAAEGPEAAAQRAAADLAGRGGRARRGGRRGRVARSGSRRATYAVLMLLYGSGLRVAEALG